MKARLRENALRRWILVHENTPFLGWSGKRWVTIDKYGVGRGVQVSNFKSQQEASDYAEKAGFKPVWSEA